MRPWSSQRYIAARARLDTMAFDDDTPADAGVRHRRRRQKFATLTAERLRAAVDCQFSLLPYHELARVAANWYEACAQAMLRGNYSPIDELIREQVRVAADQGFELDDLLQLLRFCRQTAIEVEGWNEDQFTNVDAVIDEALVALRPQLPWEIPAGLNYLTGKAHAAEAEVEAPVPVVPRPHTERRSHARNRLHFFIRIRGTLSTGEIDEVARTENVARGGLYFLSRNPYIPGANLTVTYPYWQEPGAINKKYPAKVVRVDSRTDQYRGVAVQFLVSLGRALR
ncbi:MAG: PilZ domain-containing protein [Terriglobia bacterium]